jgi:hypothetical protein
VAGPLDEQAQECEEKLLDWNEGVRDSSEGMRERELKENWGEGRGSRSRTRAKALSPSSPSSASRSSCSDHFPRRRPRVDPPAATTFLGAVREYNLLQRRVEFGLEEGEEEVEEV